LQNLNAARCALFAIGNRKSKIAIVVVPVVQRIEQGFPNAKTSFSQEFADIISNSQMAILERLEHFLRSSLVITNLLISSQPGDTTGDKNFY
jgi:hypothetical protein